MSTFSWKESELARVCVEASGGCCDLVAGGHELPRIARFRGERVGGPAASRIFLPLALASLGFSQGSDSCLIINMRLYNFDINIKTSAGRRDMRRRKAEKLFTRNVRQIQNDFSLSRSNSRHRPPSLRCVHADFFMNEVVKSISVLGARRNYEFPPVLFLTHEQECLPRVLLYYELKNVYLSYKYEQTIVFKFVAVIKFA
jgi:hypothetical protein